MNISTHVRQKLKVASVTQMYCFFVLFLVLCEHQTLMYSNRFLVVLNLL